MSSLRPLETVPLGDRAFESIRDAIVRVELPPGAPLKDRELAEALGLSRTPVREALHRLETERLVEVRGRSGWAVTGFDERDVRELFELRRLLEPAGLDRLEREPDDVAADRIAQFFASFSHPIAEDQYDDYFAVDHAFHSFLVACSRNTRLIGFYGIVESHIRRGRHYLSSGAGQRRVDETLDEHIAVCQAVRDRDFVAARDHLVAHLRTGEERMLEQMQRKLAEREA